MKNVLFFFLSLSLTHSQENQRPIQMKIMKSVRERRKMSNCMHKYRHVNDKLKRKKQRSHKRYRQHTDNTHSFRTFE